jgi:hypothetical protein
MAIRFFEWRVKNRLMPAATGRKTERQQPRRGASGLYSISFGNLWIQRRAP